MELSMGAGDAEFFQRIVRKPLSLFDDCNCGCTPPIVLWW
jgi:hypothetical protein